MNALVRYRLRILNIGCAPGYNFSIQGHNMTVIAADAVEHHGVVASSIEILSGKHYEAVSSSKANFQQASVIPSS
jgi:iron transport multicopper oxidase